MCVADEEEDEDEDDAPKTKKVKETVWDWDLLNDNKALWLRSPSDVSDEEYANFYKALAKVPVPCTPLIIFSLPCTPSRFSQVCRICCNMHQAVGFHLSGLTLRQHGP